MKDLDAASKNGLTAGWILVSGLLLLCLVGTWLTARNYRQRVFSSSHGVVLENQWPESRISVQLPDDEVSKVLPGHHALVTRGSTTHALRGEVVSVTPGTTSSTVIIRLLENAGDARNSERPPESGSSQRPHPYLPVGTLCGVTIDTTIPPDDHGASEATSPSGFK